MNIIYRSETRLCATDYGLVVHVETREGWAEARSIGQGGPRHGAVLGRIEEGNWITPPESDHVRDTILAAIASA